MSDPVYELSIQLVSLVRGLRGLHVALVEAGGVHVEPSAIGLLAQLDKLGPSRLSALATSVCLDLSTVSRQVPALERAGWVLRTRDPQDARAQLLELTADGSRALEDVRRSRADVLARLLPDWTERELEAFVGQLARFNDDITTHRASALLTSAGQGTA